MSQKYLPTEPYKGVRDFYPQDMAVLQYIKGVWQKVVEKYGYCAYDASPLESSEIYKAKSGEEIVNEQTYSFKDRGDRDVTLRPEMTPTVARMIAAKFRETPMPARWYSVPNVFRYERPQRGRLREHWQLNVDIFGLESLDAEIELILISHDILKTFGLNDNSFTIKLNSRKASHAFLEAQGATESQIHRITKLLDKKNKIDDFEEKLREINPSISIEFPEPAIVTEIKEKLSRFGVKNVEFDPTLMRGFDYYNDVVFEIFDNHEDNRRALFGGGRYDGLCDMFGVQNVSAVGFGMGDVTMRDVLETYNLLPDYSPKTLIHICNLSKETFDHSTELAQNLRNANITVSVDYTNKKIGDQIKYAEKLSIPYVIVVGQDEIDSGKYPFKTLASHNEENLSFEMIIEKFNQ